MNENNLSEGNLANKRWKNYFNTLQNTKTVEMWSLWMAAFINTLINTPIDSLRLY